MNEWLREQLVCPIDRSDLAWTASKLTCHEAHEFPVVEGVPVMLRGDVPETHSECPASWKAARAQNPRELVGVPDSSGAATINPHVEKLIASTSGFLYKSIREGLPRYPIPDLRLPPGRGERFLDVGSSWGRWSVAAARKGYAPVSLDPSLGAVLVAKQIFEQLGLNGSFVVGDARYLPFRAGSFDVVFSYSVLQHFGKEEVRQSFAQFKRVLKDGGRLLVQMPNKFGIRSLWHQLRRGFRAPRNFEVRYWSPAELMSLGREWIAAPRLTADCFFGLGIQPADIDLLPPARRVIVHASEFFRKLSTTIVPLQRFADSLYLEGIVR